jgi:hypothetical protein
MFAVSLAALCGCGTREVRSLQRDKVLLNVSYEEEVRLVTRLGFTNRVASGWKGRDSTGSRLFVSVEPGPNTEVQNERTQKMVIVTAHGVQVEPWHFPANERVTDDGKVAVWQDDAQAGRWQVRSGEWLPTDCWVEDVSGDWIAIIKSGGNACVARLDAPTMIAAELPGSPGQVAIYASGQTVHVFTRRGWRNKEGPMRYLVYDFARSSKPTKDVVMPKWARITLDMDPETGFVVINDNNSFWGRSWLYDLNTGKRRWISTSDWTVIVKKDVAEKWIELTKP